MVAGIVFVSATVAFAQSDPSAFINKACKDNDNKISMQELDSYAATKFVELDGKGSTSLSREELGDRISDADFAVANNGNRKDQTLSRSEFIRYADLLFRKANTKGDKTLSAAELGSPSGQRLMTLLQ